MKTMNIPKSLCRNWNFYTFKRSDVWTISFNRLICGYIYIFMNQYEIKGTHRKGGKWGKGIQIVHFNFSSNWQDENHKKLSHPRALHSSSNFRRLCSGALIEGKIMRLMVAGRCLVPAVDSDSIDPLSFMMGRSALLRTVADTRSFQILPSW